MQDRSGRGRREDALDVFARGPLIGYIEDASRDADRARVRRLFRSHVRLILKANRIADGYNLMYCTAGITQELAPEPAPDLRV